MEGYLEIADDCKSAAFYVKFPKNKGVMARRLDENPSPDAHPPLYFKAVASKAFIDYGTFNGLIHRDGDMPGANFVGSTMAMGLHFAVAGNENVTAENPFYFDIIHSVVTLRDKNDEDDDDDEVPVEQRNYQEGYEPLTKGCIAITFFFKEPDESYHREVPPPLTLWFKPSQSDDTKMSSTKIPSDIMKEIKKLPPSGSPSS